MNESAGAPVLILSLWLFYRRSNKLDVLRGPGEPLRAVGVFSVAAAVFGWGHFTGAPDLQLASLVGVLFAVLLAWGGRDAMRAFWVPVVFLLFALPISPVLVSTVIWPLQLVTAEIAGFVLNSIGVSSFVQGDQIIRPANTFVVIETCSGLRSVVTLTMLTVLLIDLFERRGKHALLLLLLAPVIALITNCIRVVTLVLNPHSDVASIHSLQGIVMLLVGLVGIYFLDGLIERVMGSPAADSESAEYGLSREVELLSRSRLVALAMPTLGLLSLVVFAWVVTPFNARVHLPVPVDNQVVEALGEWRSEKEQPDYKFRGGIHFRSFSRRVLLVDGSPVRLLVGLANPTNRDLSAFSRRLDRHASGYEAIDEKVSTLGDAAPPARRVVLRRGNARVLSYSWYEPEPSVVNEFFRHATALDRSPFARDETAVAIRLTTRIRAHETDADGEARLAAVYARIAPVIERLRQHRISDD